MTKLALSLIFSFSALFAADLSPRAASGFGAETGIYIRDVYPPGIAPERSVAVFISSRMFSEESFQAVTRGLEAKDFRPVVVAKDTALALGMDNAIIRPDVGLEDCRTEDYAALIVLNGTGIAVHWADSLLGVRVREFNEADKLLASVGIGTICLAEAGVLEGRSAAMLADRRAVRRLLERGARHRYNPIVTDRNIMTAADTQYARRLVDLLIRRLEQK